MGGLEAAVLAVIWNHEDGLTPAQVNAELGYDLAYTTVMTILTRLWKKGLLTRIRSGRAFTYTAALSEDEVAAQRMQDVLEPVKDRAATLARFVGSLSPAEAQALRRFLDER